MTTKTPIDVIAIMEMLPHRYPFLLVDRIVDYEGTDWAVGLKNVTFNEPHFMGHFPGVPIMPGVLIIEALAQTAGCMVLHSWGLSGKDKLVYFLSVDEAKFRKPVVPGDTLYLHVNTERSRGNIWRFKCEAKVDGVVVAEATLSVMMTDRPERKAVPSA